MKYLCIKNDKAIIVCLLLCFSSRYLLSDSNPAFVMQSIFPISWYAKGLHETTALWHKIVQCVEKKLYSQPEQEVEMAFTVLMGHGIFSAFCFQKLYESNNYVLPEDIDYAVSLLDKIDKKMAQLQNSVFNDYVLCLTQILKKIRLYLEIPRDV